MLQSIGHKDSGTTEQLNNICYLQIAQFYLFSSNLDTLYSFYCLIAVVSSSNITWIQLVRLGILILFLNLTKRLSTFHYWLLHCGFVVNHFHYVEICFLYTHLGESFYYELRLNFTKCFFCKDWDNQVFCPLFCYCGVSQWLICTCWTTLVTLGWIQLGHAVWSYCVLLDSAC